MYARVKELAGGNFPASDAARSDVEAMLGAWRKEERKRKVT
jgi:hypothetical protein